LYVPSELVVVVRTCAVSTLVNVTVAFGTTAPELSFSVPDKAPVEADWLNSAGASIIEQRTKTKLPITTTCPKRLDISLNIYIPHVGITLKNYTL
jgi:hypothetical protein